MRLRLLYRKSVIRINTKKNEPDIDSILKDLLSCIDNVDINRAFFKVKKLKMTGLILAASTGKSVYKGNRCIQYNQF